MVTCVLNEAIKYINLALLFGTKFSNT